VICCVGDGAYIFGSPTAAHFVSRAYGVPVLFVVFQQPHVERGEKAVQTHASDGWAVKTGIMPLTELDPAPDYELVCRPRAATPSGWRIRPASGGASSARCAWSGREAPGPAQRDLQETVER